MIVDVYTSLNSPWAYLGARDLETIMARSKAQFRIKPTKFAEVFAATGGLPLAQRPAARRAYRMMELKRWSKRRGIPMVLTPKHMPCDETHGVRLVMAASNAGLNAFRLAREISKSMWELDQNFAEPQVLDAALARAEINPASLAKELADPAALDAQWSANTQEALNRGVFGAPSFVLPDGEFFWGQDRLEFLAEAVGVSLT
jgi:2-hydroxychromene-2-carboxylate isomerase